MKFSHSRSGRGRRRGRKCKLSAAEPRRGSASVCVRVSVRVRGGSRGGLSAVHTQHTPGRRACTFNQSILRSPSGEKVARPLFPLPRSPVLVLLALAHSLALRCALGTKATRAEGAAGAARGARASRRTDPRPPAAPAPPRRRPPPRRPRSPPGLRLRGAHSGTHPGGARRRRAPPPRARCHESDQSDKLGGRGGGGPHASRRLRAGESPTRPPRPGSLPHGPTHPSPCARKEKNTSLSSPHFFLSLFSLFCSSFTLALTTSE